MASSGSTDTAKHEFAPVSRRQFVAFSSAGLFAGSAGIAQANELPVIVRNAAIATPMGDRSGYFVTPQSGTFAALAIWAHSGAQLSAYRSAAKSLAARGHAVMVVEAPVGAEPQTLSRMSKAVAAWLASQPGTAGTADDYALHSFSGAHGRMTLASRSERLAAAQSAVLVTLPKALSRMPNSRDTFAQLARSAAGRLAA